MQQISVSQLTKQISALMHRYHVVIFVVVALGSLIVATLYLNSVIGISNTIPAPPAYQGFDKATITKIDSFETAEEQQQEGITMPTSKRNPFVE